MSYTSRLLVAALLLGLPPLAGADISKASDWVGMPVVTDAGRPLGHVEDFAIDIESARIRYVVVSVGSFLITDSLIAVHPDALGPSADGRQLVIHAADLAAANRFGASSWPSSPDVLPVAEPAEAPRVAATDSSGATDDRKGFERHSGKAVISDGRRQATLADGERRIEVIEQPLPPPVDKAEGPPAPDPATLPLPAFDRLDLDKDRGLSRREIGARLGRSELFHDVDLDDNEIIDQFEYEVWVAARAKRS